MPPLDPKVVQDVVRRAREEDVGPGDVTTRATVPPGTRAPARITQKAPGVVFGLEAAELAFAGARPRGDPRARAASRATGATGGPVLDLEGSARGDPHGRAHGAEPPRAPERRRHHGRRYVDAVDGTGARILDTRKTTPGLRALEKAAVARPAARTTASASSTRSSSRRTTPRWRAGWAPRCERARDGARARRSRSSATAAEEVDEALEAGAPRVLLDNMGPAELRAIVPRVDGRAALEASGGMTLETLREVAETGVDFVSLGALTHSAPALDLSLLLEPLS